MAKRRKKSRKSGMRGLGAMVSPRGVAGALIPVGTGAILTAGTTLGLRAYLRPTPGTMSETLYRWAPAVGILAGLVGSGLLMGMMKGGKAKEAASVAAATSVVLGGMTLVSERLNAASSGALMALGPAGDSSAGLPGLGALMPEYAPQHDGLGAIVMEPLSGAYGDSVNVAGLGAGYNPSAFGTKPF